MKLITNFPLHHQAAGLLIFIAVLANANASSLLYYQLGGSAGGSAAGADGILDSGGGGRNGTAQGYGTGPVVPTYSGSTPGTTIRDGVGGPILNNNNATSIKFTAGGVATGNYATNGGGQITLSNAALSGLTNFTAEAFVKVNEQTQFASIMGFSRVGGATWQLDTNPTGGSAPTVEPTSMNLRARFDHQVDNAQPIAPATGIGPADGQNQSFGGGGIPGLITTTSAVLPDSWHHVALTVSGGNTITLFVDYVQVATGILSSTNANGTNQLNYDANSLFFIGGGGGGRGFDGLMDEIRLSDSVLTPSQFLYAIPEPSHALLLVASLATLGLRRRR